MKKPEIHILNEGEIFDKNRYKAIFGDFDKDGIENLDDPNPTKKGDTTTVEERKLVDGMSKLLDIKNNETIFYEEIEMYNSITSQKNEFIFMCDQIFCFFVHICILKFILQLLFPQFVCLATKPQVIHLT